MQIATSHPLISSCLVISSLAAAFLLTVCAAASTPAEESKPFPPRIDSVVPLAEQPHETDPAVIWFDDFSKPKPYAEQVGEIDEHVGYGGKGGSVRADYVKGEVPGGKGSGSRRLFFGDSVDRRNIVRSGEHFRDIYWRIYVRHQHGWTGNPNKMSRATTILGPGWRQGMIAHVWDGGESLAINPATGIRDSKVVVNKYNDFDNLRWWRAHGGRFTIHATEESGYWVAVEARAKLNTPGKSDGIMQLWMDGRLEAEITDLDWHGNYKDHGINAVFLEAYWNRGSPVTQSRWYDGFVVSTEPIGPVFADRNPVLIKSVAPQAQPGNWQAEIASDADGQKVVWKSGTIRDTQRVRADEQSGSFTAGGSELPAGGLYYVRVREMEGEAWSEWSHWHQPFRTAAE